MLGGGRWRCNIAHIGKIKNRTAERKSIILPCYVHLCAHSKGRRAEGKRGFLTRFRPSCLPAGRLPRHPFTTYTAAAAFSRKPLSSVISFRVYIYLYALYIIYIVLCRETTLMLLLQRLSPLLSGPCHL